MIGGCVIFAALLFFMDYSDLSWSNNKNNYIGIVASVLIIMSMIMSNRHENAKKKINMKVNQ